MIDAAASCPSEANSVSLVPARASDGPRRGRRGVVELVGQPGRQGAQRDKRLALAGRRLDVAGRPDQTRDEVDAEREPRVRRAASAPRPAPAGPGRDVAAAGRHVDAVLVPGAEPAGPLTGRRPSRRARCPRDRRGAPGRSALEQHPPVLGRLCLVEQLVARLERQLVPRGEQLRQLVVGEPVEQRDRPQLRRAASDGRQVAVDQVDRHRALADGRGHPLHASPGARRRRRTPRARWSPARTAPRASGQPTRRSEASRSWPVTTNPLASRATVVTEPVRARGRADEDEQPARRHLLLGAGRAVAERQRLQVAVAARADDLRLAAAPRCSRPRGSDSTR